MIECVNGGISEDEYMGRNHLGTSTHQTHDLLPTGTTRHDDRSRDIDTNVGNSKIVQMTPGVVVE